MKKAKLTCITLVTAMTLSMTDCAVPFRTSSGNADRGVTEIDVEKKATYGSSKEVIQAYWDAFSDVSKEDFATCFPNGEEKIVNDMYDIAVEFQDIAVINKITVDDREPFDVEELDIGYSKDMVDDCEYCIVTVNMTQKEDGTTYEVADHYDIYTIKIGDAWYIAKISEAGAEVLESTDDETGEEPAEESVEDISNVTMATDSYLTPEVQEALDSLQTDYAKVNWGVTYSVFEDYPGIVISVAPMYDGYCYSLVVGITNLYDTNVSIDAEGYVKNTEGENAGDFWIYAEAIGPGSTYIQKLDCEPGQETLGEIRWNSVQTVEAFSKYVSWEADWTTDGENLNYSISCEKEASGNEVYALALNKDGFIMDVLSDYNADIDTTLTGSMPIYNDLAELGVEDFAFFANPTTEK